MWLALLSQPPVGQAVFVDGHGTVLGFASAGPSRGRDAAAAEGELCALFVEPGAWGAGLGAGLLQQAIEYLQSIRSERAKLWVLDENARARRFYEARGCADLGEERTDARGRFLRYGRSLWPERSRPPVGSADVPMTSGTRGELLELFRSTDRPAMRWTRRHLPGTEDAGGGDG